MDQSLAKRRMNSCENYCSSVNHDGFCPMNCIILCNPPCLYPSSIPPPLSPPSYPPISIPAGFHHHPADTQLSHFIPIVLFAAGLFFFSSFNICRYYRNTQNSPPAANTTLPYNQGETHLHHDHHDHLGEFNMGEEEEYQNPVLDHPIWYIRTTGLLPSVINGIAVFKFRKDVDDDIEGVVHGKKCSVCLNEFEEDEILRILPKCSHAFHIPCIDTWLTSHTKCPNCRSVIVSPSTPVLPSDSGERL